MVTPVAMETSRGYNLEDVTGFSRILTAGHRSDGRTRELTLVATAGLDPPGKKPVLNGRKGALKDPTPC